MAATTILVTGAGGFIGREVASNLAAQQDVRVLAGTRDGRAIGNGTSACRIDVCEAASLAAAMRGVDMVVHCAVGGRKTTIEGSGTVLRAAREAGVRRVVHLSSIAVYGAARGAVDETTSLVAPNGDGYAHWKAAAEALCHATAGIPGPRPNGLEVAVLRPAIVYGPHAREWLIRPARRLLSGGWGGLGVLGAGTCNPVHVRDVAAAVLAAVRAPTIQGVEAFNISGDETLSWNDWYARVAATVGCPPPREMPPVAWRRQISRGRPLKALVRLVPPAGRLFERQILAAPARSELALFGLDAVYPSRKALERLGWQATIGLEQGFAELRSLGLASFGLPSAAAGR